ncbi:PEP-CTERM exosortase interaction domain protein [Microcystis sp. MC19]|uniref:PEP-CTERM sorting domain-containing protein n=1 Tax=Microcystis sp. MC19 TaxID=1967666 RepID=UPI000D13EA04|nr:PEP-CTERM sorting domain-containing protein [Microcystis sp. MC19]AVQ73861.1 PEP-CTERM exosortase interaction domain protein [Microcystis sp. MC19]
MNQKILRKLISFAGGDKLGLLKLAIASSCLVIVPQVQVRAASIPILNHSFESPTAPMQAGNLYYSMNVINNWTLVPNPSNALQGVFSPMMASSTMSAFTDPIPDGSQTAYSNGGTISQVLNATLQANTRYTLGAYVGNRNFQNFPTYSIQLWAGTNLLASNGSVIPADGRFSLVTVNHTSGSMVTPGQALEIRLVSSGVQANFDLITLNATPIPIPEPSAILGLLGFGLLGIGLKLK